MKTDRPSTDRQQFDRKTDEMKQHKLITQRLDKKVRVRQATKQTTKAVSEKG